jgi:hypothetical protein
MNRVCQVAVSVLLAGVLGCSGGTASPNKMARAALDQFEAELLDLDSDVSNQLAPESTSDRMNRAMDTLSKASAGTSNENEVKAIVDECSQIDTLLAAKKIEELQGRISSLKTKVSALKAKL